MGGNWVKCVLTFAARETVLPLDCFAAPYHHLDAVEILHNLERFVQQALHFKNLWRLVRMGGNVRECRHYSKLDRGIEKRYNKRSPAATCVTRIRPL